MDYYEDDYWDDEIEGDDDYPYYDADDSYEDMYDDFDDYYRIDEPPLTMWESLVARWNNFKWNLYGRRWHNWCHRNDTDIPF